MTAEIAKALRTPAISERLRELGLTIIADCPEGFARFIAAESANWRRVVELSGARVN